MMKVVVEFDMYDEGQADLLTRLLDVMKTEGWRSKHDHNEVGHININKLERFTEEQQ